MKLIAFFTIGFAALVMATPVPEAAAEAGISDITAALPHALAATDKIMTSDKPVDLVSRQSTSSSLGVMERV